VRYIFVCARFLGDPSVPKNAGDRNATLQSMPCCVHCGSDVLADANLCLRCGKPLAPLNPFLKAGPSFNLTNPHAVEFASQHAAESTQDLTEQARQAIRLIVTRAFVEGGHPYSQAREIVKHLDLTSEEGKIVETERARLEGKRYKGERLSRAIDRFAGRLLRDCARMIAHTAALTASNRGQLAAWHEAVRKGILDPQDPQVTARIWIVSGDPDTCAAYLSMQDRSATLFEPFETPLGPRLTPPMHDGCRCCMALQFDPKQ